MAVNKRFLGLGFTFAATDKGLLKELKAVQGALSGISDSLGSINSSGKSAGSALGKMKFSGAGTRGRTTQTAQKTQRRFATGETKSIFSKSDLQFLDNIKETIGGKAFENFSHQLEAMEFDLNKTNKITGNLKKQLNAFAIEAFKSRDNLTILTTGFKNFFKSVGGYLKDIAHKTGAFFESLGVDLKSIIPPQLTALGSLVGSLVSPIVGLGKSIGKMIFPPQAEKIQKKLSAQIGGSGTGKSTIFGVLKEMLSTLKKPEDKRKGGILGSLVSGVGGFFGGLISGLKSIPKIALSAAASIGGFFKSLFDGEKILAVISDVFNGVWKIFGGIAKIGLALLEFKVFESALKGIFQGVEESLPAWKEFWGSIKNLGSAVVDLVKLIPNAIGTLFGKISDGVSSLRASYPIIDTVFTLIGKFFDMITDGWKKITEFIPVFGKMAVDGLTSGVKSLTSGIKSYIQPNQTAAQTPAPFNAPDNKKFGVTVMPSEDPNSDKQTMLLQQMVKQQSESSNQQNDLLQQLVDKKPVTVNATTSGGITPVDLQNELLSAGGL